MPTFNEVFPGVRLWDKVPDAMLKDEYKGKGFAYQDVYNNYVNALHDYNKKQTIKHFPGAASWYTNQERQDLGLGSLGRTNYDVFAYPLMGAMFLPMGSALSGVGLAGAAKYTASQVVPWVAKNVLLPYLAGEVWNEANKVVTGNDWATNVANSLEKINVPRDYGMAVGSVTNPFYYVPWNGVANAVTNQTGKAVKSLNSLKNSAMNGTGKASKDYIIGKSLDKTLDVKRMPVVNNAFRNNEWNNFLNTKNGDYYYRLSKGSEYGQFENEKNYFLSHTTPWEEFSGISGKMEPVESGIKSAMPNGYNYLIEIPTETFGKL